MNVFCSTPQMGKRYSTIPFDTTLQSKQMETIGESLYPKRSTKIFLFSSFLAFPYGAFFRLFQFLDNIAYDIIRQCLKYYVLIVDQFIQGRFNDRPCGILLVFIVCFLSYQSSFIFVSSVSIWSQKIIYPKQLFFRSRFRHSI